MRKGFNIILGILGLLFLSLDGVLSSVTKSKKKTEAEGNMVKPDPLLCRFMGSLLDAVNKQEPACVASKPRQEMLAWSNG